MTHFTADVKRGLSHREGGVGAQNHARFTDWFSSQHVLKRVRQLAELGAFAFAYFLSARFGLMMDAVSGYATLVWPATGLAVAVLFLVGLRMWPGVWVGAALVNWLTGAPLIVAAGIATGNTLEAGISVVVLRRLGFHPALERLRDILALVLPVAVLVTMASATIGVGSLLLGGVIPLDQGVQTWRAWWLGDLIAAMVVAPVLITWGSSPGSLRWRQQLPEATGLGLVLVGTAAFVFAASDGAEPVAFRQPYLVYLPLIWAALRFESRYVTLAILAVSATAVIGTSMGNGPFARPVLHESLELLQAFMAVLVVSVLILRGVTAERALLLVREASTLASAQCAEQRYAFLAHACATIDSHLDVDVGNIVARLAVPFLADWCVVDLDDGHEELRRRIVLHRDPAKEQAVAALEKSPPFRRVLPVDIQEVFCARTAVLVPEIPESWFEEGIPDPEDRARVRELGIGSSIHVPMVAYGRVHGVISLVRARDSAGYTQDDLVIAEALGRSAAQAVAAGRALRHTEESRRLLLEVVEGTSECVYVKDCSGRYVLANSPAHRAIGKPREEVLGKDDAELFPPHIAQRLQENDRRILASGTAEVVEEHIRTPEGVRVFLSSKAPHRDAAGCVRGIIGVSRDITERKRMEEALREADRRKNQFLAVLSHEMRNPLAPIRNSIFVLRRAEPGGEQAQRALSIIDRQSAHMTRLIEDLLDVTRISRGKIQLQRERVVLNELVRSAAEDHRQMFLGTGVRFEVRICHPSVRVDADATRLTQVVGNLLQNAAKFTPRGGQVALTLERDARGMAVMRVQDTGCGIPPDTLPRLFEPFVQAEGTLERSRGGLGLGLALVKGIVELHDGTVAVHSEGPGRGAEFIVRLPVAEPVPQDVPLDRVPLPHAARRVLVIEDNADAAQSLKDALEIHENIVSVASTGVEGIERARTFNPDVVLCDIGLPGLDGYGVARTMRADSKLSAAFLVALSGYALKDDVERSKAAGFDRHMAKPPDMRALEELLAEAPARTTAI